MERLSASVILLIGGIIFLILATMEKLNLPGAENQIAAPRWILWLTGLILVGAGFGLEWFNRNRQGDKKIELGEEERASTLTPLALHSPLIKPEAFFVSVNGQNAVQLDDFLKNSKHVRVVARSAVNILSLYMTTFDRLAKLNCRLEFVIIAPQSSSVDNLYGTNPAQLVQNISSTTSHVASLRDRYQGLVELRYTSIPPSFTAIQVQKTSGEQFIFVVINFSHSATGLDRPAFIVAEGDRWYDAFSTEINSLWLHGKRTNE